MNSFFKGLFNFLRIALLTLVGAWAIYAGALFLLDKLGAGAVKEADKYPVLRDLLVIVLSAAGIAIAVFGIGTYKLLSAKLKGEIASEASDLVQEYVAKETTQALRNAVAWSLVNQGYQLWMQYLETKQDYLLEMAIQFTNGASQQAQRLDPSRDQNEELICVLKKQLGFVPS